MVIYSSLFVPSGYAAITIWPFIFMTKKDDQLLTHEMVHFKEQAWITPIWFARYIFSTKFRVAAEVRAHKVQMQHGLPLETAARWLVRYDKKMTIEEATRLLS